MQRRIGTLEEEKQRLTDSLRELLETHKNNIKFSGPYDKKEGQWLIRYTITEEDKPKPKDLSAHYDPEKDGEKNAHGRAH